MNFLRGKQRESFRQVEAHLITENALCADSRTIMLYDAILTDMTQ